MADIDSHPNPENILTYDLDKASKYGYRTINNFTSIKSLAKLTGLLDL